MTAVSPGGDGVRERVAAALCNADATWEHHDQTDDHPCSRCKRDAAALAPLIAAREDAARAEGKAEAWAAGENHGIRLAAQLVRDHVVMDTGDRVADFLESRADRKATP